jgi:tetratricopeptide (TPR) repeat protein
LNTVGYYPPARALIIRGTSRYHSGATIRLNKGDAPMAAAPKANGGAGLAQANPPAAGNADAVAAAGKRGLVNPNVDAKALQAKLSKDPKRAWSEAIDWTVTDPGLIVATAEFLMQFNEFGHAAEVLKGNLRKGLSTDAWAHEALSIALQMSQGSPAEIERAAVSAIDLDPTDAKAYLKAAKVEHDLKNHDLAVAFCKKAAEFGPDQPRAYANALVYAEASNDVKADSVEWAVGNLLKRDWSNADGIDYHAQAKGRLESLVAKYKAAGAKVDGLNKILTEQTSRDVVIELLWQGSADLDLSVTEPSGSVCSATRKRTTGGGVLAADILNQTDSTRAEVYTAATAFSGTYKVGVKRAFGQAIGNTATVKVTRFKGTPKESHDLFTVNLSDPKPIEVKVDGGNRTELAVVTEDVNEFRAETTGAAVTSGPSGLSGGVGTAGSAMTAPVSGNGGPALPVVLPSAETRLAGIGAGAADMRMDMKVNADRKTMTVNVRPVFAMNGKDVAMPKVSMMPGGEGGR